LIVNKKVTYLKKLTNCRMILKDAVFGRLYGEKITII
jgi:hypothetical protein